MIDVDDDWDDGWGNCSTCGDLLLYEICPSCSGDGVNGDGTCEECAGRGEVLCCACSREAREQGEPA